jgi:hypothetical protein
MTPLPPHAQAAAQAIADAAPPLSPRQQQLIARIFTPPPQEAAPAA